MTASVERAADASASRTWRPAVPETLESAGLTGAFLDDLILKTLYTQGARTGQQLTDTVRIAFNFIDDRLIDLQLRRFVEVRSTHGPNRGSYLFDLTGAGRERAREAFSASQYIGPAPVPLAQYRKAVIEQSIDRVHVTRESLRAEFGEVVLHPGVLETLGPAVNSAKSLFLFGDSGNGKTLIAETISRLLGGAMYVPHAVEVDGEIVVLRDPVYHRPAEAAAEDLGLDSIWLHAGPSYDRRYFLVHRPVVLAGGELTLDQLDLQYDGFTKLYQAPFQVKANGGVLIIDDFGRQRVPPRDLLNRWIVPLEKRIDYLTLHTGTKFPIPFNCLVIFATNLEPQSLVEEAFLRRIHYKVHVASPTQEQFAELLRRCCAARGIPFRNGAVEHVYQHFYERKAIAPRSCHPRDLTDHICDIARFLEVEPSLSTDLLDRACHSYFIDTAAEESP